MRPAKTGEIKGPPRVDPDARTKTLLIQRPKQGARVLISINPEQAVRLMQALTPAQQQIIWCELGIMRDAWDEPDPRVIKISDRFADEHFLRAMAFQKFSLPPGVLTFERIAKLIVRALKSDKSVKLLNLIFMVKKDDPKRASYSAQIFRYLMVYQPALLPHILMPLSEEVRGFLINTNWVELKGLMLFWHGEESGFYETACQVFSHLDSWQQEELEQELSLVRR